MWFTTKSPSASQMLKSATKKRWLDMTIVAAIPAYDEEIAIESVITRAKQHKAEVTQIVI